MKTKLQKIKEWVMKYLVPVSKKYAIKYLKVFGYKIEDKYGNEV